MISETLKTNSALTSLDVRGVRKKEQEIEQKWEDYEINCQ